jgi:hypothetical protein
MKKSLEEHTIMLMRLLSHWLRCYVEDKESDYEEQMSTKFGVVQIEGLQKRLEQLKEQLINEDSKE